MAYFISLQGVRSSRYVEKTKEIGCWAFVYLIGVFLSQGITQDFEINLLI